MVYTEVAHNMPFQWMIPPKCSRTTRLAKANYVTFQFCTPLSATNSHLHLSNPANNHRLVDHAYFRTANQNKVT